MNNENEPRISVIEPVGRSIERTKVILFQPFSIEKWLVVGFCAWLAYLGGGGGGGGNGNFGGGQKWDGSGQISEELGKAWGYVVANLFWIIPVFCAVTVIIITIMVVLTWLRSRGEFMFLHCVAGNKAEVKVPWSKYRAHGNSLFIFRVVVGIISTIIIGFYIVMAIMGIVALCSGGMNPAGVIAIVFAILGLVVICIVPALISKFTADFVVPIMMLGTSSCIAGWRRLMPLLMSRLGSIVLYILFQILIGIVCGAIVMTVGLVTCCCAFCFLAIPFVGTVLMLPLLIFRRAYSLYFLSQFGPEYDVFAASVEPAADVTPEAV